MHKLHFSIIINAPREKVWDTVIGEETYPRWTEVFSKGSHFKGDWSTGSKMLFLGPNAEGKMEGMVAKINENRPPEFLSIQHIGFMKNGVEDTESDEVKAWTPAYENYTLKETVTTDGAATEFIVDMDFQKDEHKDMFEDMWPKSLQKLKELCEK